jgi:hypothetical protein
MASTLRNFKSENHTRFNKFDPAYRDFVLPPSVRAQVSWRPPRQSAGTAVPAPAAERVIAAAKDQIGQHKERHRESIEIVA